MGLFAMALVIRLLVDNELPPGFPYLTFFPSVILSTLICGLWPGIANAVLSGISAWYFFIAPFSSFALTGGSLLALGFYVFIVTVDIAIIHGITLISSRLSEESDALAGTARLREDALEQLKQSEERQRLLAEELGHRLKNTMSMVQAIVGQTLRPLEERRYVDALERRLLALSSAHDILLQHNWRQAPIREIAAGVCEKLGMGDRMYVGGPAVQLTPAATLNLSLILHELATNAIKYGAFSRPSGRVHLAWDLEGEAEERCLAMSWRELGGPEISAPERKGFGSRLLNMGIAGSGGVDVDFRPQGLVVILKTKLADIVPMAP